MTTGFIELLKDHVSSIVLNGETEHLFEKDLAIKQFLPILLNIFKSKPEWLESLTHQLNPRISDLFAGDPAVKQQLFNQLGNNMPADQLESTLNQTIAPTLNFLETEAGSANPQAIVHLLEKHSASIAQALPAWAAPVLASMGIPLLANQTLHQQPSNVEPPQYYAQEEKKKSSWLPFVIFLILAAIALFLYKACTNKKVDQTAVAPATQTVSDQPASLQLSTGANAEIVNCSIFLNNPSYLDILQKEVKQIFNHTPGCGADTSAANHTEFTDQDTIPSVLKLIKGVPNLSLSWIGDQVSVQAANAADADRVAAEIRNLAKNVTVTTQQASDVNNLNTTDDVDAAITSANTSAEQALSSIKTDNVRALDVATALNLQIINFATASSEIPEVNKTILDQAAGLLKRASHVNLKVVGHTDAQGDAAKNKVLSQERAKSIVDYLVAQGVDPAQLQAVGMGAEKPRADNATEQGRFQNRRIEFEVLNTETGVVRAVDEQGVKEQ